MAANVYMKEFTGGADWVALASARTIMNVTIVASSANATAVSVRVNSGDAVSWAPGMSVQLEGVDLSQFEVDALGANVLVVVGYTR